MQLPADFASSRETLGSLIFLLGQLTEEVVHTPWTHFIMEEIEAQREVGIGGLHLQVDQATDGISTSVEQF